MLENKSFNLRFICFDTLRCMSKHTKRQVKEFCFPTRVLLSSLSLQFVCYFLLCSAKYIVTDDFCFYTCSRNIPIKASFNPLSVLQNSPHVYIFRVIIKLQRFKVKCMQLDMLSTSLIAKFEGTNSIFVTMQKYHKLERQD